jgi:hypothetical protein
MCFFLLSSRSHIISVTARCRAFVNTPTPAFVRLCIIMMRSVTHGGLVTCVTKPGAAGCSTQMTVRVSVTTSVAMWLAWKIAGSPLLDVVSRAWG